MTFERVSRRRENLIQWDLFLQKFFNEKHSFHKNTMYNLNLPGTQSHSFHLLEEQHSYGRWYDGKVPFSVSSGISIYIPFFLSLFLCATCFFFVNFLWKDLAYSEIFDHEHEILCPTKDHLIGSRNFLIYMMCSLWLIYFWFENIKYEGYYGYHTRKVNKDYKICFILFICSELMFFVSIFWAFFHFSLGSNMDMGYVWPPFGIDSISYLGFPLFNTLILLTSGLYITWSHNALKAGNFEETSKGLEMTIYLGILFLMFQYLEYLFSNFNINDSVFGSIFFFGTGFHGLHVLLGTVSLIYNFNKLHDGFLSSRSHYSFLFTIWYWHFVYIVWLFLYLIFYIWGQ